LGRFAPFLVAALQSTAVFASEKRITFLLDIMIERSNLTEAVNFKEIALAVASQ
jgi:hypothetical protein